MIDRCRYRDLLDDYLDGEFTSQQAESIELHLTDCESCRQELASLRWLQHDVAALSPEIVPAFDLWDAIEAKIDAHEAESRSIDRVPANVPRRSDHRSRFLDLHRSIPSFNRERASWRLLLDRATFIPTAIFLFFIVTIVVTAIVTMRGNGPWHLIVAGEDATTWSGERRVMPTGEWIETGNSSRALLSAEAVGDVEIEPNSRVRLLDAREEAYRIALAEGTIHARINAPPRLFAVETPSATAIDLGCAYTLHVDDHGASRLDVTSGRVALELWGHESIVPQGAFCTTRPGVGPGTPCFSDASASFLRAVARIDSSYDPGALDTLIATSRIRDSFSLWYLLWRLAMPERERLYERLAVLSPPPPWVSRDGVLRLDSTMLYDWRIELESTWGG